MLSTSSIVLNSYVNFNCYAPAVLGSGYQGAEVLAILDYDSANRITPNLAVLWASVYPSIQSLGYVNDYTKYPYLKLRTSNGTMVAIAFPWIQDTSYLVQQAASLTIVIDSVNPADQANITAALASIGVTNFTITSAAPVTAPTPTPTPTPSPGGGSADTAAADFNFTVSGLQATFTDTSIDPSTITAWSWNFGDSSGVSTVQNPSYTYAAGGTYVVTLTITDSTNTSYQTEGTVTVTAPAPSPTPL
jgi:PKD repeat protein